MRTQLEILKKKKVHLFGTQSISILAIAGFHVTSTILKSKLARPAIFLLSSGEETTKNIFCHKFPAR